MLRCLKKIVKSTNVRKKKLIVAKMEKKKHEKNPRLKNKTRYLSEICLANFEFLILLMKISKKKVMQKEKERKHKTDDSDIFCAQDYV